MKGKKPEILYSEPVKEIMGSPPRRILRWGTVIVFSVFVLFILFAWFIRYPDTLPAPVEITTENPPVNLAAKITGRIQYLYVKEKENVRAGQLLAVMETTASIDEIQVLKGIMDTLASPGNLTPSALPGLTELGELQGYYASFLKALSDYDNYSRNDFYGNKIKSLTDEINGLREYITRLSVKEELFFENRELELKKYMRDSLLFSKKVIPESELEESYQSLLQINIDLQQVRLEYSAKIVEIAEKQQLLQDYRIMRQEEKENLLSVLEETFLNLSAQLNIWRNNYLLVSPIEGTISFTQYWSVNQSVLKDEPVINIVPHDTGSYLGRIYLKMQRSGKVKEGQLINIKLSGYPYLEYGMVRGVVKSKSLVPAGDSYVIEIELPNGLTTLYEKDLEFSQEMQGTAEIITEDIRLLQKIINPFRYIISKNKR